ALILELMVRRGTRTDSGGLALTVPLSYEDLADWADAEREAVAHAVDSWRKLGIVKTGRGRLTIVDANELERVSGDLSATGQQGERFDPLHSAPLYCAIFATDIAHFGDTSRDDGIQANV